MILRLSGRHERLLERQVSPRRHVAGPELRFVDSTSTTVATRHRNGAAATVLRVRVPIRRRRQMMAAIATCSSLTVTAFFGVIFLLLVRDVGAVHRSYVDPTTQARRASGPGGLRHRGRPASFRTFPVGSGHRKNTPSGSQQQEHPQRAGHPVRYSTVGTFIASCSCPESPASRRSRPDEQRLRTVVPVSATVTRWRS
jgi:hypothetical protein